VETRDEGLLEALSRAVDHVKAVLGPDMDTWRWDTMHTLTLKNSSRQYLPDGTTRGPYPMEGDSYTVDVAEGNYYRDGQPPDSYPVGKVPSIRMVLDFSGGTVKALNIIPGGQSEDPDSVHYNDQTGTWLANENRALPFTRGEVEADAEARWSLPTGFPNVPAVKEEGQP
jgi:penicillin amidase